MKVFDSQRLRQVWINSIAAVAFCFALVTVAQGEVIAFWPFGEKYGLDDASGNGHALSSDGSVTIGETATFDGKQKLFCTAAKLNLSLYRAVTIEFWIRYKRVDDSLHMVMEFTSNTGSNPGGYYIDVGEQGSGILCMWNSNNPRKDTGVDNGRNGDLGDGEWHHVAYIINRDDATEKAVRLFVDGQDVSTCEKYPGTKLPGAARPLAESILYLGSRNNGSYAFVGELDNVKISAGVLKPEEFVRLDGTVATPEPLVWWPFGAAGTADMSGNGHSLFAAGEGLSFTDGAVRLDAAKPVQLGTRLPIDFKNQAKGLTAEFWMCLPPDAPTTTQMLLELTTKTGAADVTGSFYLALNDFGKLCSQIHMRNNTYHGDFYNGTPLNDGKWHHVALVIDLLAANDNIGRLYLDGVEQAQHQSYRGSAHPALANGHVFIGSRGDSEYRFTGLIDDVRITAGALSPAQFQTTRTTDEAKVLGHHVFARGWELAAEQGQGSALTATGATFANGAALFDGEGSLAAAALPDGEVASDLTAECWYKTDAETVPLASLFRFGDLALSGDLPGTAGAWRHVAVVFAGREVSVFLDGDAQPDLACTLEASRPAGVLTVGGGFVGAIDDLRITEAALSPAAFLKGRTDDTPIVLADWKFTSPLLGVDETGRYPMVPIFKEGQYDVFENMIRFAVGRGIRTSLPLALSYFKSFTIECVYRSSSSQGGILLEYSGNYNDKIGAFCLSENMFADCVGAGIRTQFGYAIRCSDKRWDAYKDGAWHRMAFSADRTSGNLVTRLILDGVEYPLRSEHKSTADTPFVNDSLHVAGRGQCNAVWSWDQFPSFVGDIDEIRLTNAVLPPESLLGAADREPEPTVLADWTFDDPVAPLKDASGNGNDLTGEATFANGTARFSGAATDGLHTLKPLLLSSHPKVTVEVVFRTDEPTLTQIIYELSSNYNNNIGSLCAYLNGNGTFDAATKFLTWQSGKVVNDSRWHHLVVYYDFDAVDRRNICRYVLDGIWAREKALAYVEYDLEKIQNPRDDTFFIGTRGAKELAFRGEIDRVRVTSGTRAPEHLLPRAALTVDESNLVAYWPFEATANWKEDASSAAWNLVTDGKGVAFDDLQGCVAFEANHDILKVGSNIDFGTLRAFTVECYAKLANGGDDQVALLGTALFDTNVHGFNLSSGLSNDLMTMVGVAVEGAFQSGQNQEGHVYTRGVDTLVWGDRALDNRWHHYALVLDRDNGAHGTFALYVDHQLIGRKELPLDFNMPAAAFEIGSVPGCEIGRRYRGFVDDVRITAAALQPEAFLQHRTSNSGLRLIVR